MAGGIGDIDPVALALGEANGITGGSQSLQISQQGGGSGVSFGGDGVIGVVGGVLVAVKIHKHVAGEGGALVGTFVLILAGTLIGFAVGGGIPLVHDAVHGRAGVGCGGSAGGDEAHAGDKNQSQGDDTGQSFLHNDLSFLDVGGLFL